MIATADSWNIKPFQKGTTIPYEVKFSQKEYEVICNGFIPKDMEDKWFIYFEKPYLYFHRSWTGVPVYRLTLSIEKESIYVSQVLWNSMENKKGNVVQSHGPLLDSLISSLLLKSD